MAQTRAAGGRTIDAAACYPEVAQGIVDAGADYCPAAKRNTSVGVGVANRRFKAVWDEEYLTQTVFE